jgi:NhaP-type Na+/H+ and K+/H+ antiporter
MFFSFLITGLLSPFSEFFLLALEEYGVQMALLSSTIVVILAVFSHLCEMFVGVKPCLLVFRYFLCLPLGDGNDSVECCSFQLHPHVKYIA